MSLSVAKECEMQVVFHASDLTVKCSQYANTYDRIVAEEDFTIVGAVTINHGNIPSIGDFIFVEFRGKKEIAKITERAFNFKDNLCEVWMELVDLSEDHDGSEKYTVLV
jgi:hypothetical protein